jgi:CubicO group peptidase (beta-lactamase class C family)
VAGERVQAQIQAAADELVGSGAETGLQVAVIKDGKAVADVAVGLADPGTGAPVCADTLFWAASTAKGVASSVAHVLVERGELDYDLRAADVWPEFASRGEDAVTLRHVLLHTAGVPGLPPARRPETCATGRAAVNGRFALARAGSGTPGKGAVR